MPTNSSSEKLNYLKKDILLLRYLQHYMSSLHLTYYNNNIFKYI